MVCVCVFMYTCVFVCVQVYMGVRVCICVCMFVYAHVHMCVRVCTWKPEDNFQCCYSDTVHLALELTELFNLANEPQKSI